jgi:hypothetical protein
MGRWQNNRIGNLDLLGGAESDQFSDLPERGLVFSWWSKLFKLYCIYSWG